ncbi:unnamed protein product [Acanthosepion pharaonis]|uniref:Uncharacterized protein n=1 Tax=Acanthosepion pharaonis TaxID=158019 RepID=A0A812BZX1_ACAPH|nr:unnamed protein product [Sepia pharaonis]
MAEWKEQLQRRHQKSFKQKWNENDSRLNTEDKKSQSEIGSTSWQKYVSYRKDITKSPNAEFLPRLLMTPPAVHMDKILWKLLCDEVLADMIPRLVRNTLREVCEEYLETEVILSVIADFTAEIILEQDGYTLVNEVLNELYEECFLVDKILNPVMSDLLHEIAADTIEIEMEQQFFQDSKEVNRVTQQNLLDSFLFEELLNLWAQQGRLWTETEEQNRILDGFIMDALLNQLDKFQEAKTLLHGCVPFNKLHQRIVTDISLNVLLERLSNSLMEDERELDNFEQEHKAIQSTQETLILD